MKHAAPTITGFQETNQVMPAKTPTAKAAPAQGTKAPAKLPVPAAKGAAAKPAAAPAKAVPANTVTLKHLAAELAEQQRIEKRQADAILTGLVGLLVQHLTSGDRLRINGLGILEVKDRPERAGHNPATGEAITIKASKKIAFRPAKELKETI